MAFELKKVTLEDQKKILEDIAGYHKIAIDFRIKHHFSTNPDLTWAIDTKNHNYLVLAPFPNVETPYFHYVFHFNGNLYEIYAEMVMGSIYFKKAINLDEVSKEELKQELKKAFAVYGLVGNRNLNDIDYVLNASYKEFI